MAGLRVQYYQESPNGTAHVYMAILGARLSAEAARYRNGET